MKKCYQFYTAFKIKKTLPEIEKYLKKNPLSTEDLEKMLVEQEKLLQQVKEIQ